MKRIIILFVALFALGFLLEGCKKEKVKEDEKPEGKGPEILALVNGEEITDLDLDAEVALMHGPHGDMPHMDMMMSPRHRKDILERVIEKKLVEQAAEKEGLTGSPEIEARVELYKNQLLLDELRKKILSAEVQVTEQEMKEFYEKHTDMFGRPRMIRARQIVTKDREKAEKVLSELQADPSRFEDLAREYSEDTRTKDRGGDMGNVQRHMYPPELDDALFALEEAEISEVIDMHGRFYILEVYEKEKPEEDAFEKYKDQIRRRVEGTKKHQVWVDYMKGLKDQAQIEYMEKP
jgi:EpsD family peptidyl-prolyl cis-trans isomerase